MPAAVLWFRRDLRLRDHPALLAAAQDGPVTALFVLDDALRRPAGAARLAFLYRTLRDLDEQLRERGGGLTVRRGQPENVVPAVARECGAAAVHIGADFGPYGAARDKRVAAALGETPLVATGSPYAVAPGRVTKGDGGPFQVYTAFYRAWVAHGWRAPAGPLPGDARWRALPGTGIPQDPRLPAGLTLPEAGEAAALDRWRRFAGEHLTGYAGDRDRPDLDRTSRLSPYLKFGSIHPRTILADLPGDSQYRREIAWREFYAAVLHFWPDSARRYFLPAMAGMDYDSGPGADAAFAAWVAGRTGFPIVDAGMRQLLAEGWMHNRVRMIVASFLVKDLHIEWTRGARHFMTHLVDGDLASNQHGWQWTAGTGTDAAPYFRIFNPVSQGTKFDPGGAYIRRWVPELAGLPDREVHEPWRRPAGPPDGYPGPIVDHAVERRESLARYSAVRGQAG
jgi:deoxyribodipyrimidine photo-lyase